MHRHLARLILPAAAVACLALPASADVTLVDAAGFGHFDSLVDAVAAASSGDTLLVRPGDYRVLSTTISVSNRSLVIAAYGTGPVLTNPFEIAPSAGQRVVLRGLTVEAGTFDTTTTGLHTGGAGDILLEGCTILGRDGHPAFTNTFGGTAIVSAGSRLVVKDCTVEGGRGSDSNVSTFATPQPGGYGINVLGNDLVAMYGGTLTGGDGGNFIPDGFGPAAGSTGGIALITNPGGTVLLAGCAVTGGDGGSGNEMPGNFNTLNYAAGGGVVISSGTKLTLLDATLAPGVPGVDGNGTPGFSAVALTSVPSSVIIQHAGSYRANSFGGPTGEGDLIAYHYDGAPGDLVAMFLSFSYASQPLAVKQGLFHLGTPILGPFVLGPVGGTGELNLNIAIPNLSFGPNDALLVHEQSLVKPVAGESLLTGPTALVLLDDVF